MGCYGIGTTRLLAAALESLSLPDQIRWPRLIAPHQICIIPQQVNAHSSLHSRLHYQCFSFDVCRYLASLDMHDTTENNGTQICIGNAKANSRCESASRENTLDVVIIV